MEPLEPLRITPQEVMRRVEVGETLIFVDARPPELWDVADATIPNAIHVPPGAVEEHLGEIARFLPIVTYCTLPGEAASAQVARELSAHHREGARPLQGGFEAWRNAGYPVAPK
jgi:rhodanese-related sulfurtransferase